MPTKEDGASAAAQQLGSMSLSESAGKKKDDDTEPAAKNGTQTKMCSACGKSSDTLKKCAACKCVWYCDKKCQNKHRKEHKEECRPIKKVLDKRGGKLDVGTELNVGPLGKMPPREECPICMRVLPIHENLQSYFSCCGMIVCGGCNLQHQMKSRSQRAEGGKTPVRPTCAFCRTAMPKVDEVLARRRKRIELKDPDALRNMGLDYGYGNFGLPVDQANCIDYLRQSGALGDLPALYQLGLYYHEGEMGLEQNDEEALKYWEEASEGGHLVAQHNLACMEERSGNQVAALCYWRLSASEGFMSSMNSLISCFRNGLLHHEDLAETVQAMYRATAEMKSEDRNKYIQHLKMTGAYDVSMDS